MMAHLQGGADYLSLSEVSSHDDHLWKLVWTNLAPTKVEIFTWQLLKEPLPVKSLLVKRGDTLGNDPSFTS